MVYVKDTSINSSLSNLSSLSQEEINQKVFLDEYANYFTNSIPRELPPSRGEDDHRIDLILGTTPLNKPPYRVSLPQQEEIMGQVNELVEKEMVQPRSSPFCSPVLLVQKKDGSYRMCVDYHALNNNIIKNRFPVPRKEDLFDKLQGSSYFTRIDLKVVIIKYVSYQKMYTKQDSKLCLVSMNLL